MTDSTIPEIACPSCSAIDWGQDGFAVRADDVKVDLGRVGPGAGRQEPWTCRRCGYPLDGREPLAGALTSLRTVHPE